ncbi:MAG: hypothetical protein JJE09_04325 [Bacteroidia bacterium]|nr:hypothetical protein [Bacteroidia bacterium]
MIIGAIISIAISILIYLFYNLKVSMIADNKEKYEYINKSEIRWYKWMFYALGLGLGMPINLYGAGKEVGTWFFVLFFISIAGATLVGYVASLILDYYYPTKLSAKLRKLRYTPRINKKTGNKMRLLSEDEEDVHLQEGMQAEENVFSIDYDVWIDEKTSDILIEKYEGHLVALQCGNCGFYTMRVVKEEIVETHEDGQPKELVKNYQCSYCKNVRATQFHISQKQGDDYKHQKPAIKRNTRGIEMIKIEIHSTHDGKKFYEFESLEQAQKFIKEFDKDKVA